MTVNTPFMLRLTLSVRERVQCSCDNFVHIKATLRGAAQRSSAAFTPSFCSYCGSKRCTVIYTSTECACSIAATHAIIIQLLCWLGNSRIEPWAPHVLSAVHSSNNDCNQCILRLIFVSILTESFIVRTANS